VTREVSQSIRSLIWPSITLVAALAACLIFAR
jgi:hypothetical protein